MNPSALTVDEREVVSRQPGSFLPKRLFSAHWNLVREGVLRHSTFYRRGRPVTQIVFTDDGGQLRRALPTVQDPDDGWGILFIDGGPDLWWGEDAKGYSSDISFAGLYSRARALRQNGSGRCGDGRDMSVPPARMAELLDAEIDKCEARLARLRALRGRIPSADT